MTVRKYPSTNKSRAYKADLDREKQSSNHARAERAKCELELMRKNRFIRIAVLSTTVTFRGRRIPRKPYYRLMGGIALPETAVGLIAGQMCLP